MKKQTAQSEITFNKTVGVYLIIFCLLCSPVLFSQTFTCTPETSTVSFVGEEEEHPDSQSAAASCISQSSAYNTRWSVQSTYTPTVNDPIVTVKFVLHIFRRSDQTGEWQPSDVPYLKYLMATVIHTNTTSPDYENTDRYSVPRTANYTVNGFTSPTAVIDSKIRYELANIYFWDNTIMYNANNYNGNNSIAQHLKSQHPVEFAEGMPIVWTKGNGTPKAPFVRMQNSSPMFYPTFYPYQHQYDTAFARTQFRHELGHAFGLAHPYFDPNFPAPGELTPQPNTPFYYNPCGSKNYLSDVFPAGNPICSSNTPPPGNIVNNCGSCYEWTQFSNNVMHNESSKNRWISLLQMGRRTMNLHLLANGMRSNVKDMSSNHLTTWDISSSEVWDFDIQMYKDIVVKSGAKLTIQCRVAMPIGGKITVEKGGQLIIDGGLVTTWCKSGLWAGIRVEGDPTCDQGLNATTGFADCQGILHVINGGIVSLASKGATNYRTDQNDNVITGKIGGIIITDNASFLNNVRDVEFYNYAPQLSASKFSNTKFLTTGAINGGQLPFAHANIYGIRGLKFYGCTFECTATSTFGYSQRGYGIDSQDAGFTVNRFCTSGCSTSTMTIFKHLYGGIRSLNSNPLAGPLTVYYSKFENNTMDGIYLQNLNYAIIENNSFFTAAVSGYAASGVYLNSCKLYNIKSNSFEQQGSTPMDQAIFAYNSQTGAHQIYRNNFKRFLVGINAVGNNSGVSNLSDGLLMNCNDFSPGGNYYNIAMTNPNPSIKWKQGNPTGQNLTATRNKYSSSCGNQNMWYMTPSATKSTIHYSSNDSWAIPGSQPFCSNTLLSLSNSGQALNYSSHCPAGPLSSGGTGVIKTIKMAQAISYLHTLRTTGGEPFEFQATSATLINLFQEDSLLSSQDSVISIIARNEGGMEDADIQLIFAYMSKMDFANAATSINDLSVGREDWKSLLEKLNDIYQEDAKVYSLLDTSKTYRSWMEEYADTEKDGNQIAKALLSFVCGAEFSEPRPIPGDESTGGRKGNVSTIEVENVGTSEISVYPNPTIECITVKYTASEDEKSQIRIEIRDLLGKVIFSNFINNLDDGKISLLNRSNGVYFITAMKNKEVIYRSKIVKQN